MLRRTSDRKKKWYGQFAAALMIAVLLACFLIVGAVASESDRMPKLDEGMTGTLKVTMTYTIPNAETDNVRVMPGVQVKLAQVAELHVNGGSAEYTLLDDYRSTGIELTGMTASESNEAAKKLARLAAGSRVRTAVTDNNGIAVFDNLEPGMYLVFQDTDANAAYQVEAIATFLTAVPYPAQSADGNNWQYTVEAYPKTELPGPRSNGVIRVTKQLLNIENHLFYNPPENQEVVFYVGLFTDKDCKEQAAGTSDQPLRFLNSDYATAVFENLETDRTYYVAETDGKGNAVPTVLKGEALFAVMYPDGQSVEITREKQEGEILFYNTTRGLPLGYYYGGTLTVTKKTELDGNEYETDDVFYAALFTDKKLRSRYGDVITLEMNGSSSVSVPLEVRIGISEDDSAVYYVAETDSDGNPLQDGEQEFTISLNKKDGKVSLTPASPDDEVIITNKFTEQEQTETEPKTEPGTEEETERRTESGGTPTNGGGGNGGSGPRTGDETPVMRYVALMAAALVVILGAALLAWRRRKER